MVEQEIAKLDGYGLWKTETSFKTSLWSLQFNLFPQSPFITCTFSFPMIYDIFLTDDQFEPENTHEKKTTGKI